MNTKPCIYKKIGMQACIDKNEGLFRLEKFYPTQPLSSWYICSRGLCWVKSFILDTESWSEHETINPRQYGQYTTFNYL